MPRVIINADDFGLSPGISRGIVAAFREGVLTSTTMLVNMPSFDDGVGLAHENPDLPMGIHLSLLWGPPVSTPSAVPTLVERDGWFPRSLTVLARRYYLGTLDLDDVRTEFRAQVERFRRAGLRPTHVDTHKHVHCLPGVLRALADVATEQGIRCVRLPREEDPAPGAIASVASPSVRARAKARLVAFLIRGGRRLLAERGLKTTDHFAGIASMDRLDAPALCAILSGLREGVTEVMCHPGYDDDLAREYSNTPPHRDLELAALRDPAVRACLAARGIERISYNDI
jgi:hopanoid biosynthesis associated protein HpnK